MRRILGGLQPLWGTGVTSRLVVIFRPSAGSARSAASRPDPGPFTCTSIWRMPCSFALRTASSVAVLAAKGVLLREPWKPTAPVLDQDTRFPWGSVNETIVVLKVAV